MKILFIGEADELAESFVERMIKEEHELYLFTNAELKINKGKYKFYKMTDNISVVSKLMHSIAPEAIVFACNHFAEDRQYLELGEYYNILLHILEESVKQEQIKQFTLLSSTEVYDNKTNDVFEDTSISPESNKGVFFASLENLLSLYYEKVKYHAAVLRLSDMYCSRCDNRGNGILSRAYSDIEINDEIVYCCNGSVQMLHVDDAVDAMLRVIDIKKQGIYNVASRQPVEIKELYESIISKLSKKCRIDTEEGNEKPYINCDKIIKELEWVDYMDIISAIRDNLIIFREKAEAEVKTKRHISKPTRESIENILIFALFFAIYSFTYYHKLFSNINWMMLYVILIAMSMGIKQSIAAIVLSSASYLFVNRTDILQMTNFYSYSESILVIIQFIVLGIGISYTYEGLKRKVNELHKNHRILTKEYKAIENINRQNVKIKKEYEKRLLESETGIPRLYAIMRRLNKLSVDAVFAESLDIFSEFLGVDSMAIYYMKEGTHMLRLMNSRGDESSIAGKTWDLSGHDSIRSTLSKGEIYIGNVWKNEPAIVLPIIGDGITIAVIALKAVTADSSNLYDMNMIRTLGIMISDSAATAIKYEESAKSIRYVTGTQILRKKTFNEKLELAVQREKRQLADYSLIEASDISPRDMEKIRKENLRETDDCGAVKNRKIAILLNNTSEQEMGYVIDRLLKNGVKAKAIKK